MQRYSIMKPHKGMLVSSLLADSKSSGKTIVFISSSE